MYFVRLLASFVFVLFPIVTWAQTCTMFDDKYNIIEYDCIKPETIKEINAVDKNGNTALCRAVILEDVNAYLALKANGANTEHKCINNIPKDKYESFLDKVASSQSSSSFLGLNKRTWAYMGLGAAGVVGAVAAMGMGGGSGGGSGAPEDVYPPENTIVTCKEQGYTYRLSDMCPEGWIHNSQDYCDDDNGVWFKCDQKAQCDSDYYAHSCPYGYEEVLGDMCISGNTVYKKCIPAKCDGYKYYDYSSCPDGWEIGSSCLSGETKKYKCDSPKTCPGYKAACENGYEKVAGSTCLSGDNVMFKCQPASCDGYEYTDASECPAAWQLGSSCKSGTTTKYKCDKPASCEGYDYDSDSECPSGWEKGSSCQSGNSIKYMCDKPASCTGYQKSCSTGYEVVSGDTCLSGTEQLVKCAPAACEGFNYTTCPQGWDPGESCLSGNTTKYKCDVQHLCQIYNGGTFYENSCPRGWKVHNKPGELSPHCYSGNTHYVRCVRSGCSTGDKAVFLSCDEGWYQVSNPTSYSCTESGITYSIRCEPYTCSSSYKYTSSYECPEGWELGSSCKSGDSARKYKCDTPATCPYTTTACTGGYQETGNTCKSGNNTYKECEQIQCGANATWAETGCVCDSGYQNWTQGAGCEQIQCGANATWAETKCICNDGYQNWTDGEGCSLTPLSCGVHAHQEGAQCVCDHGYDDYRNGYGCYEEKNCGINAHQEGPQCVCDDGYQNWTEDYGCYEILDCGANATQHGDKCICNAGYQDHEVGYGCYATLNCGANSYQEQAECKCNEGYQNHVEGIGCSLIPLNCGQNATQIGTECKCNDGFDNWQEGAGCEYTAVIDCGANAVQNGRRCECESGYTNWIEGVGCTQITECGPHAYMNGNTCACEPGYENWQEGIGCSVQGINDTENADNLYINNSNDGDITGTTTNTKSVYITNSANGNVTGLEQSMADNSDKVISIDKFGNGNIYGLVGTDSAHNATDDKTGIVAINNSGNGDIYGIYNNEYSHYGVQNASGIGANGIINISNSNNTNGNVYGTYSKSVSDDGDINRHANVVLYNKNSSQNNNDITGTIKIANSGSGNVYGMYNPSGNVHISDSTIANINASGVIDIKNTSESNNVYGIYKEDASRSIGNLDLKEGYYDSVDINALINLKNTGNGNVYGIYSLGAEMHNIALIDSSVSGASDIFSTISITNYGNGNSYGLRLDNTMTEYAVNSDAYLDGDSVSDSGTGLISISNQGTGDAYGIHSYNAVNRVLGRGIIDIENRSGGNVYGLYGGGEIVNNYGETEPENAEISLQNLANGKAYGIFAYSGNAYNFGTININNIGNNEAVGMFGDTYSRILNAGTINITHENYTDKNGVIFEASNTIAGNIYGIYANNAYEAFNSYVDNPHEETAFGDISLSNYGVANAYGIYSKNTDVTGLTVNAYNAPGDITIGNYGTGNAYGIYTDTYARNAFDSAKAIGNITIDNYNSGNAYGMYATGTDSYSSNAENAYGYITIHNHADGDAYGMYGKMMLNASFEDSNRGSGTISLYNYSSGNVYGMYGEELSNDNSETNSSQSFINIQNLSNGNAFGLYATNDVTNFGTINIDNSGSGSATGIYVAQYSDLGMPVDDYVLGIVNINNTGIGSAIGIMGGEDSIIEHGGEINITRNTFTDIKETTHTPSDNISGDVFGIYGKTGSLVKNYGDINITTNGNAYGIYAETNSTVNNAGNITVDAAEAAYGIYAEGDTTVINSGTITLNGVACSGADCNTGNYIVLNGSTLVNAGTMSADTLSLNSMGGTVRAATGSRFVATDAITGDLNISSELVSSGNQTTYVAENMIDAGDVSGLNLVSESALFNARLASNGHDVVMTMRGFDDFTDNKSLAAFLERNYASGNNTDLFGDLKSIGTNAAFMGALNGFSGLGAFNQFANEDLAAMREMNFSMNEQLFETSGRDDVDISGGVNYFSFSNQSGVGSGSYGLSIDRISDKWKMGYGISMANISTGNDDGINRQNTIGLFYMPMTYTDSGYEVIVNPKIGFSRGEYNRQGFNNMSYEGYIEKRIFGLMNDIRYPLTFGNWTVAPNLGLNAIVYNQSGHEENKMYGLIIPDSNLVSVEAGLGLYAKYDRTFADNSRLSFNTGLMAYREFGDCYNIKLGIRGMDGTFDLYDNNLYDYRGAATIGFKYNSGRLNLHGNAQYFTDSDSYMNLKAGIRFAF